MKDILTKKRVKVDYRAIINLLGLSSEYRYYHINRRCNFKPMISERREMLCFLRSRNVNIRCCTIALKSGCNSLVDLIEFCGNYKAALEYAYGL